MDLKFGIFDHVDRRGTDLARYYDERIELVAAADAAGFHGYHVAEHHLTPISVSPNPSVYLAAVARQTKTIRMGPMVYLLPFYQPLRLIEEVCMLDALSGGRLEMGVGRGVSPFESGYFNINTVETGAMFEEALDVLIRGLTEKKLNHRGTYYKVSGAPMDLAPTQKPYPPLWYGVGTEHGREFAAEWGMNIVMLGTNERIRANVDGFRDAWKRHAGTKRRKEGPVQDPLLGVSRHVVVADSDAKADEIARPAYAAWYKSLTHLSGTFGYRQLPAIGDFDQARKAGVLVVGSPDTVRAELAAQLESCGHNYVVLQLAFGSIDHADEMRTLDLFSREVMPALSMPARAAE